MTERQRENDRKRKREKKRKRERETERKGERKREKEREEERDRERKRERKGEQQIIQLTRKGQHTTTHCHTLPYTATHYNRRGKCEEGWGDQDGEGLRGPCLARLEQPRRFSRGCCAGDSFARLLQYTATECNILHHVAAYYYTLQHTATHCNALQHTATHCNILQHKVHRMQVCPHSLVTSYHILEVNYCITL